MTLKSLRRGERRARTVSLGRRRSALHLEVVHWDGVVDCVCERSAWWFAKRRALGCNCRSRERGAPKVGRGPCRRGFYRPKATGRSYWRRERHLWLLGVEADQRPDCSKARRKKRS